MRYCRFLPCVLLTLMPLAHAVGAGGVPGNTAGMSDTAAPPGPDANERTGEKARNVSSFDMLDRNKDGRLSPAELKAAKGARIDFERADTNHDGYLSTDEYNRAAGAAGNAAGDLPASTGTASPGQ